MNIKKFSLVVTLFHAVAPWILFGASAVHGATLPAGFNETRVAEGLNPTTMTFAPDGRLYVCEKQGLLHVVKAGKMMEKPVLDITERVDDWNERGLQSVCFDPEFARNGWIYIYYTHNRDPKDSGHRSSNNRVSRFTVKNDVAAPGSEVVVLEIDNLSRIGWHNGGGLAFGADGKLYVSTGENSKDSNAQDGSNLLGKLLRINKDGSIPNDNPYYQKFKGKNRAITALGLRNPYTIAVQPGTGMLYISMVGARYEQIERYESGKAPERVNYGWPKIDGPPGKQKTPDNYRAPEYAYDHGSGKGLALCGGEFLDPSTPGVDAFPSRYHGKFFFSDYAGWIKMIDPSKPSVRHDFATGIDRPIDVACSPDGSLWYLERAGISGGSDKANSASENGALWRVSWTGDGGGDGAAASIAVIQQPTHSRVDAPIGAVRVAFQDTDGQTLTTANGSITLAIGDNPSKGKLQGTTTVAAVQGVATFPSLTINRPGRGYTLLASSGTFTASSNPFEILPSVAPATITPGAGDYSGPIWVSLSSATPGATIRFTLDGEKPDATSPVYKVPFQVTSSTTIKTAATRKGLRASVVTNAEINITGSTPYGLDSRAPVTGIMLPATAEEGLPATLSATRIFTDKNLTPRPGVIPYSLNSTIWADGAEVQRWVILPGSAEIGFSPTGEYQWPGGTIFVQHFEIVTDQSSGSRRRLETRILVLDASGFFGYGANYRWRADGNDADLVDVAGAEEVLKITEANGTVREQTWMYPSRGLCFMCHTPNSGFVLGPKTRQLNGSHIYPGDRSDNQLRTWNYLRMFSEELDEESIKDLPHTCRLDDTTESVETRFRSYLDGNCSNCHRPGGTGAQWDARFETPLDAQGIINSEVRNNLGVDDARLLVPGDVAKSIMHTRIGSTAITDRMPPITRNVPDAEALEVLTEWIQSLDKESGDDR